MRVSVEKNKAWGYNGNVNILKHGAVYPYSEEEIKEYLRCKASCEYFVAKYCKITHMDHGLIPFDIYPYQKKMFDRFIENRFNIVLSTRQSGKTTGVVGFLAWKVLFHAETPCCILAHKADGAQEVLTRIMLAIENLPYFLQPGCKTLNKRSVDFSNNSGFVAASAASNSIRGKSIKCVTGDTMIVVEEGDDIYHVKIADLINKSKLTKVKMNYLVYKITNKTNNKVYVGYHGTVNPDDGYMGSGKLIKRAIEKYGIDAFQKEILHIFETPQEAEQMEKTIVNREFVLRDDTYNLAVGGNIRAMPGRNNPFFGKTHTKETLQKISDANLGKPNNIKRNAILVGDKTVYNFEDAIKLYGDKVSIHTFGRDVCGNPLIRHVKFLDKMRQERAESTYEKFQIESVEKKEKVRIDTSKRFKGKPKTPEHSAKISKALVGKSRENPQNRDPEKIRKTAEKHRGMKRTEASKKRMSDAKKGLPAQNRGKSYYRSPEIDGGGGYFVVGEEPIGWLRGTGKRKK